MDSRNVATKNDEGLTKWYDKHGLDREAAEISEDDSLWIKQDAFEKTYNDTKLNDVRSEVVMRAYAEVMQSHVKGIVDMVADAKRNGLWVEFNASDVESFDEMIQLLRDEEIIEPGDENEDAKDAIRNAMDAIRNAEEAAAKSRSEMDDAKYSMSSAIEASEESESYCDDARGELDGVEL
jgi:hypothetical protein